MRNTEKAPESRGLETLGGHEKPRQPRGLQKRRSECRTELASPTGFY